jgi:hypothetical protein
MENKEYTGAVRRERQERMIEPEEPDVAAYMGGD